MTTTTTTVLSTDPFTLKFLYLALVALVADALQLLRLGQSLLQGCLSLSQVEDLLLQNQVFPSHLRNRIVMNVITGVIDVKINGIS